ncbi:ubiquinol-cytochrome C chaperone family protein [Pelagibacterium lentulum]|uniref:Ubiquinol-cytochrome c chaperone n=1 Tax=Pelagibacterium lentulum TaxID=2029865 RepID=A0A916VXV0_9HYPH|nr:ubiquinol-cytochrome C chaperone family protein [Pelagibacterium lentulum]GGA51119.1 ubiquinol-cytochrome c chaperone [Pelagibacterium lentulum]
MILPFFRKNRLSAPVYAVYNAIVAQSRHEIFYAQWSVPDTLTGRFDMISLHMAMVFRRLRQDDKATKEFAQALFDCFFFDMDRSLREMGVGDLSVGKRIEKMGSLFYGMLANLNAALDSGDANELESVISRNILDGKTSETSQQFAAYINRLEDQLRSQPASSIVAGELTFGAPA